MLEKIKKYTQTPEYAAKQERFRQRIAIPGTIGAKWLVETMFRMLFISILLVLITDIYVGDWLNVLKYLMISLFDYPTYKVVRRLCVFLLSGLQATSITYQLRLSSGKMSGKK